MRYITTFIFSLFIFTLSASAAVKVEIYTIPGCFGCGAAKSKFEDRGIPYTEINLQGRRDLYVQMKQRVFAALPSNERGSLEDSMTVPRIFINGKYIGGYGDLDSATLDKIAAEMNNTSTPNSADEE